MTLHEIMGSWCLLPSLIGFIILIVLAGLSEGKADLFSGDDDEFF